MKELIVVAWYIMTLALFSGGFLADNDSRKERLNYWGSVLVALMLYIHLIWRI